MRSKSLPHQSTPITRNEETEARLQQLVDERTRELELAKQAAEAASSAKSTFLANMSHELRTPMNAVIGLSHLVLQDTVEPKQIERMQMIVSSAQRLLLLLNDILDLTQVETGRLKLDRVEFDLAKVIDSVKDHIEDSLQQKGLAWSVTIDPDVPAMLVGDPLRIGQVLLNFAANAVKFTDTGGIKLLVRRSTESAPLPISAAKHPVRLRFEITDTGIGIAPHVLARLFQPFEQADVSTTRQHGGSGLGLTICRHIAHLMEGEVGATSHPGAGSTFWLEASLSPARIQPPAGTPAALKDFRAILVGPSDSECVALLNLLMRVGLRVNSARNGLEVCTRVDVADRNNAPYDLVIFCGTEETIRRNCAGEIGHRLQSRLLSKIPLRFLATRMEHQALANVDVFGMAFDALIPLPVAEPALHDILLTALDPPPLPHPKPASPTPLVRSQPHPPTLMRNAHDQGPASPKGYGAVAADTSIRVLVVEDNPINLAVITDILGSIGITSDTAENGQIALNKAQAFCYDLILMDMQMPVMDGPEATRAIRKLPGYAEIPILAVTANAFAADRQACLDAGMNDHLAKPFRPDQLHAALRQWLPQANSASLPTITDSAAISSPQVSGLANISGLDAEAGLTLMGGNTELYWRLLGLFVSQHAQQEGSKLVTEIEARIATHAFDEARRAAHSLKGSAATVGANTVRELAFAVEQKLKAQQIDAELRDSLRELKTELATLTKRLQIHFPAQHSITGANKSGDATDGE